MKHETPPGFDWDPQKAALNFTKHRVSFMEAATIFIDPQHYTNADPRHSMSEDREFSIGISARGRLLFVVHTRRSSLLRIISARKAVAAEVQAYEAQG